MKNESNSIFCEIISRYLLNRETITNACFKEHLKEKLFTEEDTYVDIQKFFQAVDELAKVQISRLPIYTCLIIEEERKGQRYIYIQKQDGDKFYWNPSKYESIHKWLRIILFYCVKRNRDLFEELISLSWIMDPIFDDPLLNCITVSAEEINRITFDIIEENHLDEVYKAFDTEDLDQKLYQEYEQKEYYYILDKKFVSRFNNDSNETTEDFYVAIVMPIVNEILSIDDIRYNFAPIMNEESNSCGYRSTEFFARKVLSGKFVKHKDKGYGEIKRYYSFEQTIDVVFLSLPGDVSTFSFPEVFDSGEMTFVEKAAYNRAVKEEEGIWKKRLIGKKVSYRDTEYDEYEKEITVDCIGTIEDYIDNKILIKRDFPMHENHRYAERRGLIYPTNTINLYRIEILDEEEE